MTLTTKTILPLGALTLALALMPAVAAAQDAALVKKGQEVYAAQKCSICHAIAGKGGKTNPLDGVGAKLSADDIRQWIVEPGRDDEEDQVDEEAADAGEVRQAAGGRSRRARRLHAEPQVSGNVASRATLSRHPLAVAGALLTTVSAVVFIALVIAVVAGLFEHPYAGLVVFVARPRIVRARSPAHPARDVAGSQATPAPSRGHTRLAGLRSPQADDAPNSAGRHRADRRQHRDRPARRQGRGALDGFAVILRPGVSSADAPAVHRVAGGAALGSHVHRSVTLVKARRRSCAPSSPARGSCITS